MNVERFVFSNKNELLGLFGQFYSVRSLEYLVEKKINESEIMKKCCLDAVICKRYYNSEVDFPFDTSMAKKIDSTISEELYSIVLCEEGVREGVLQRAGMKYSPVEGFMPSKIKISKKYIIP